MADAASIGAAAARLLLDPTVKEIFEEMRAEFIRDWENSADTDPTRRETAWRGLKGLERFKAKLQSLVDNAKIEASRQ